MGTPHKGEPLTRTVSLGGLECSAYPGGGSSIYNDLGVW